MHAEADCNVILEETGENCTSCGCSPAVPSTVPFGTELEFYLAVTAVCVFVIAIIFVGICLCRRNRAQGGGAQGTVTDGLLQGGDDVDSAGAYAAAPDFEGTKEESPTAEYARVR